MRFAALILEMIASGRYREGCDNENIFLDKWNVIE